MHEGIAFYRCTRCHSIVSLWDIKESHGCGLCGGNQIVYTNLTFFEKIKQILKHPKVWRWKDAKV